MEKPQPKEEKKEEQIKQITIPKMLTIKDLADAMKIQPSAIVKKLFLQGKIVTVNQEIDSRLRKRSRWSLMYSASRK